MYCTDCGNKLREGGKFCGNCGARVATVPLPLPKKDWILRVMESPSNIPVCNVSIHRIRAEEIVDIEGYEISAHFSVSKDAAEDWSYLEVRAYVISPSGALLGESRDVYDQLLGSGESKVFEITLSKVPKWMIGDDLDNLSIVVQVTAKYEKQIYIGEIKIPHQLHEVAVLDAPEESDSINVISGSLWKEEVDNTSENSLHWKLLLQNITMNHYSPVRLHLTSFDGLGRELAEFVVDDDLGGAMISDLSGDAVLDKSKARGGKCAFNLKLFETRMVGSCKASTASMGKESFSNRIPLIDNSDSEGLEVNEKISADVIYSEWIGGERIIDLDSDLVLLLEVLNDDDAFVVCQAYMNYLIDAFDFHEDFERDVCYTLHRVGGIYDDFLGEAYRWQYGEEADEDSLEEEGVAWDDLHVYVANNFDLHSKREFLYRYLVLHLDHERAFSCQVEDEELALPQRFHDQYFEIVSNLLIKTVKRMSSS
jgi:hypothetical protein